MEYWNSMPSMIMEKSQIFHEVPLLPFESRFNVVFDLNLHLSLLCSGMMQELLWPLPEGETVSWYNFFWNSIKKFWLYQLIGFNKTKSYKAHEIITWKFWWWSGPEIVKFNCSWLFYTYTLSMRFVLPQWTQFKNLKKTLNKSLLTYSLGLIKIWWMSYW